MHYLFSLHIQELGSILRLGLFVSLTQVPAAAAAAESESTAIRLVVVHFAAADSDSAAAATCCSFQKRRTLPQPQTQKVGLVLFV